jgi:hypothetical protein
MHRRSEAKLQRRHVRAILFASAFIDRARAEAVSRVSRADVLGALDGPVEVGLVPDVEKGEILVDCRGQGSFQR